MIFESVAEFQSGLKELCQVEVLEKGECEIEHFRNGENIMKTLCSENYSKSSAVIFLPT